MFVFDQLRSKDLPIRLMVIFILCCMLLLPVLGQSPHNDAGVRPMLQYRSGSQITKFSNSENHCFGELFPKAFVGIQKS